MGATNTPLDKPLRVLITGSSGFIGRNLRAQLEVRKEFEALVHGHESTESDLRHAVAAADFICHLAGVNRPDDAAEFARINTGFTQTLCDAVRSAGRAVPIIFASSVHVERDNLYGRSKLAAEKLLLRYSEETGAPVYIFRLPHVIGKWCRPNYNSVVATFCHNIARDLPIEIADPAYPLNLVYIDDLVDTFAGIMLAGTPKGPYCDVVPSYPITVGELAEQLREFRQSRTSLVSPPVGNGLARALYATYISYLPPQSFSYPVAAHADPRGIFVEMLKTTDSGQFSFFTAPPGVTRGGHYHHSKSEKFLVLQGTARFRFRQILSNESHELTTSGDKPEIVDTIPGWAHDITNIGSDDLIVMLWANEIFDPARPDTYASKV